MSDTPKDTPGEIEVVTSAPLIGGVPLPKTITLIPVEEPPTAHAQKPSRGFPFSRKRLGGRRAGPPDDAPRPPERRARKVVVAEPVDPAESAARIRATTVVAEIVEPSLAEQAPGATASLLADEGPRRKAPEATEARPKPTLPAWRRVFARPTPAAPRQKTVLEVDNLTVTFPTADGPQAAVNEVSLTLARGEVLGLVGESGAGKSVLGAALINLVPRPGRIASGSIILEGERIDALPERRMRRIRGRRIGLIPQDPLTSLNPLIPIGRQLVETIRAHRRMSGRAAWRRAVELLEGVGIPAAKSRLRAYPHEFSGGMRQRVVIALALAADPVLVVADEPTTALDVSVQAQVVAVLKRMCREHGAAVLLVTHDIGLVAETADRVAVLYAGRIVEEGPVAEVIGSPRHPYTVGLMRAIPSIEGAEDRLVAIPGAMPRLGDVPPGCPFSARCPEAWAKCVVVRPPMFAAGNVVAACWLLDPAEQAASAPAAATEPA